MRPIHKTAEGHWVISDDTHLTRWVTETGRLDHDRAIDRIIEHIHPGGVAVDAGASIGDHTIAYARKVGSEGMVMAFEPNPDAFACLAMNMREFPQVVSLPCGLGRKDELAVFNNTNDCAGVSAFKDDGSIRRPVVRLDTLSDYFPRLDFIKLDVEGAEQAMLEGAWNLIQAFRPKLLVEINRSEDGSRAERLILYLQQGMRYTVENFDPAFRPTDLSQPMFDAICFPL